MKAAFLSLALLLCGATSAVAQKTPQGVTYDTQIIRTTDGDTVVIAAPFLPAPLKPELAVRIFGVDTPEKGFRGQCASEKQRGEQASEFTTLVIKSTKKHQVILYGWDKFGGRVLGDVIIDGKKLSEELIKKNLARPYFGDAKKSWCE